MSSLSVYLSLLTYTPVTVLCICFALYSCAKNAFFNSSPPLSDVERDGSLLHDISRQGNNPPLFPQPHIASSGPSRSPPVNIPAPIHPGNVRRHNTAPVGFRRAREYQQHHRPRRATSSQVPIEMAWVLVPVDQIRGTQGGQYMIFSVRPHAELTLTLILKIPSLTTTTYHSPRCKSMISWRP